MRIPKYRLHSPSGQAVVVINRRYFYLGRHNSPESKKLYARTINEYLASPAAFTVSKTDPTIAELLVAYAKRCRIYYGTGPKSEWWHIKRVLKAFRALYADIPVSEFGPLQLKAVRQYFIEGKHRKEPERRKLSRDYINKSTDRSRRMFRWGVSEGIVPPLVLQSLESVDHPKTCAIHYISSLLTFFRMCHPMFVSLQVACRSPTIAKVHEKSS